MAFIRDIRVIRGAIFLCWSFAVAGKIETVRVALAERSYDIEIGSGTLAGLPEFLRARTASDHAILITD